MTKACPLWCCNGLFLTAYTASFLQPAKQSSSFTCTLSHHRCVKNGNLSFLESVKIDRLQELPYSKSTKKKPYNCCVNFSLLVDVWCYVCWPAYLISKWIYWVNRSCIWSLQHKWQREQNKYFWLTNIFNLNPKLEAKAKIMMTLPLEGRSSFFVILDRHSKREADLNYLSRSTGTLVAQMKKKYPSFNINRRCWCCRLFGC